MKRHETGAKRNAKAKPIRSGNTTVRVWPWKCIKAGKSYDMHTVAYYEDGRRIQRNFASLKEANSEAKRIAERLDRGERDAARLPNAEAQALAIAKRELAPLETTVLDAVRSYVSAMQALPAGVTLHSAVAFYARHHSSGIVHKPAPEVVTEFLSAKKDDGASYRYLKTLRSILEPNTGQATRRRQSFGDAFRVNIDAITTADLDTWLRARKVGARTRRNLTLTLRTLFTYARSRRYVPKDRDTEADALQLPGAKKGKQGKIQIFTPDELATMMVGTSEHEAREEYQLWLALGAFSGLRTAELLRLRWGDHIKLDRGQIDVSEDIAKTAARRFIKIRPALQKWLVRSARREGLVFEPRADERVHAYAERLGIEWKQNGLRHSFVSYRTAETTDLPAVAFEAGNSPGIIKSNYMELTTPEEARKWFSIEPERPVNVVSLDGRAA